jgi:hypothetical protein
VCLELCALPCHLASSKLAAGFLCHHTLSNKELHNAVKHINATRNLTRFTHCHKQPQDVESTACQAVHPCSTLVAT